MQRGRIGVEACSPCCAHNAKVNSLPMGVTIMGFLAAALVLWCYSPPLTVGQVATVFIPDASSVGGLAETLFTATFDGVTKGGAAVVGGISEGLSQTLHYCLGTNPHAVAVYEPLPDPGSQYSPHRGLGEVPRGEPPPQMKTFWGGVFLALFVVCVWT